MYESRYKPKCRSNVSCKEIYNPTKPVNNISKKTLRPVTNKRLFNLVLQPLPLRSSGLVHFVVFVLDGNILFIRLFGYTQLTAQLIHVL